MLIPLLMPIPVTILTPIKIQIPIPITTTQILSPIPFIVCVSNLLGVQIMLPNNKTKAFNNILFAAGILSFILMYPLIKKWAVMGAAINVLLIELFVASAMMIYVVQKKLIFSKKEVE